MKHPCNETILLVDPDADARQMYAHYFSHRGFRVLAATTGHDALMLAKKADAIVTEIHLRGDVDAVDFISGLKRDNETSGIPLIVVTSRAWDTDRHRAQRAGCDLFLSKPCLPHDLVRAVRRLLAGSKFRGVERPPLKHRDRIGLTGPLITRRHRATPRTATMAEPERRAAASDNGRRGSRGRLP